MCLEIDCHKLTIATSINVPMAEQQLRIVPPLVPMEVAVSIANDPSCLSR